MLCYDFTSTLIRIETSAEPQHCWWGTYIVGTQFGTLMYLLIYYQANPDKQKSDKPEAKKAEKVKFRRKQIYVRLHINY